MNVVTPFPATKAGTSNRRPVPPLKRPLVYFAGRMTMCCPDGMDGPVHPTTVVEFRDFRYGGPYLHDRTGGHSVGHGDDYDDEADRQRIWANDCYQIARCDLFLCWIEDLKAFGTLVEIGIAHALGKLIAIGIDLKMPPRDAGELWFAGMAASAIYDATSPKEFWAQVCRDWIAPGGGRVA